MGEHTRIFRHSSTLKATFVACALLIMPPLGVWVFNLWSIWGLGMLTLICALALADVFTTRIVLEADALVSVETFRRRVVPKADIESATWESGCGVSIKLKNGAWVKLPSVTKPNAQGQTNALRAWLKRPSDGAHG